MHIGESMPLCPVQIGFEKTFAEICIFGSKKRFY